MAGSLFLQMVPIGIIQLADRWLRLPHRLYAPEIKNIMERFIHSFIQHIKDRTECFDDHFPCRKPDCERQAAYQELAEIICTLCTHGRDRIKFIIFLMDGG